MLPRAKADAAEHPLSAAALLAERLTDLIGQLSAIGRGFEEP
jgi:hypothetical protein